MSIIILKEGIDSFYEYMHVLASYEENPIIIPPFDYRNILWDVGMEICTHPRLALPDDPGVNIWPYYSIMCMSPIVMEYFLIVILSFPLEYKSLQMDLYRVCVLPALHPELKVQFTYILEGEYLAISTSGSYAAIATSHEINIFLVTQGHFCFLNSPLYPVERKEWCIYTLFIKNCE